MPDQPTDDPGTTEDTDDDFDARLDAALRRHPNLKGLFEGQGAPAGAKDEDKGAKATKGAGPDPSEAEGPRRRGRAGESDTMERLVRGLAKGLIEGARADDPSGPKAHPSKGDTPPKGRRERFWGAF